MNQQTDTEFNFLAAISLGLKAEYDSGENYWAGSPFEWIKPFGGTLAEGLTNFAAISGRPPDPIAA